jgi:hypothetical protein
MSSLNVLFAILVLLAALEMRSSTPNINISSARVGNWKKIKREREIPAKEILRSQLAHTLEYALVFMHRLLAKRSSWANVYQLTTNY